MPFLAVPLPVWARYLMQLLIMLATIAPKMGRSILSTRQPGLMALRGVTLAGVTLLGQVLALPAIVGMLTIGASGLSLTIGGRAWPSRRWL